MKIPRLSFMAADPYFHTVSNHCVANTKAEDRSGNFGGIALGEYSIAVDSGHSLSIGQKFKDQLENHFGLDVKYLVLTHTHTDHRMGMGAFFKSQVLLSSKCYTNLPKKSKSKKINFEQFESVKYIKSGGIEVEVFHVGGHTIGSSMVHFITEHVLFSGDILFLGGVNYNLPFLGFYSNKEPKTGNPEECITALEKIVRINPKVLIPGHGGIITNVREEITLQLQLYKTLKIHFLEALEDEKTLDQIALPSFGLIAQARERVLTLPQSKQRIETRWLDNYLDHLKKSFYNFYSQMKMQE